MKNKNALIIVFISFCLFFANTVFADTFINLQIKTDTGTIYEGDINVAPCDSEGDGVLKATPYCAIVQSGTTSIWTGLWVDSIGDVINNDGGNGVYWMWLANLSIDNCPTCSYSLSGKQYELQNNDKILFYYNTNPLDIIVDKENPKVGEKIKITGKELGLDSSWNPVWDKALFGKAIINGISYDLDADGEFLYETTNNDVLLLKIQKNNFIDSKELNINPEEVRRSSGSYVANFIKVPEIKKVFSVAEALKFLENNQKEDGSFGESLYTDWVAIGIAKEGNNLIKEKLIKYYKENTLESNLTTDNERRAMALMALGIDPYAGTKANYIKKIIDSFDGEQFGDKNLYNDDIFALIVLKNAGYDEKDEIIINDLNYLIAKQNQNGSWGSIDMTAAFIEALKGFGDIPGVEDSVIKSKNYIISNQESDGSFGNPSSTSWVLQTLFENDEILKTEKYLYSKQQIDGGMESIDTDLNTRIWVTSYVIPAILHKPWSEILNNFPKPQIETSFNPDLIKEGGNNVSLKTTNQTNEKKDPVRSIEDKIKIQNLIEDKGSSKSGNLFSIIRGSFNWLLVKLGF
ncbi:MAG: prenyltransferase/squalene oxidase repeat-containing protein [Candidatus Paceibacterota bacterium]